MKILNGYVIFMVLIVSSNMAHTKYNFSNMTSIKNYGQPYQNNFHTTQLHTLITQQFSQQEEKIKKIQELLASGVEVNARNEDGRTALWLATFYDIEPEIIQLLIDYGADVTIQDLFNVTPLHNAVIKDNKIVVQLLLDAGADMRSHTVEKMILFQNDAEQSPLDIAKTQEMDELLLTHEL